jgi:N-acetylneuraminic acid mutarotase
MKSVSSLVLFWILAINPILLAAGGFVSTTPLTAGRVGATATLLTDGTVLVAGGFDGTYTAYSSAVRYNPTTETWTAAGSMNSARHAHTATLLSNGKVLVAGGGVGGANEAIVASAEIYDPVMNNWSPTGSLGATRVFHEATLFPNGKVLVTGGNSTPASSSSISSCEMYDPTTGVWSPTASMSKARGNGHTATLLTNGKILVTGGWLSGSLAHCELYDPAVGTWSVTGSLLMGRHTHPAVLLPNGKVMVIGGYGTSITRATEIYDPATGLWTAASSMLWARNSHPVILLPNDKILALGGNSSPGTAEIYDINTGTWSATGPLITPRAYGQFDALLTSGKVLIAGGTQNPYPAVVAPVAAAEIYIPEIGAPALTIAAPTNLTATTATLNGTVNPNGNATTAHFEFGTTLDLGDSVSITLTPNDNLTAQSVSATLSALVPDTLYYYRLRATNGSGTSITMTGNFTTLYPPEIEVSQPSLSIIADGGFVDFGAVAVNNNTSLVFTIENTGAGDLTGLGMSFDGTDPGVFSVTALPVAPVSGPTGSTAFTVQFAPTTSGPKTAALHIASNDTDENPYDITLLGNVSAQEVWRQTYFGSIQNSGDGADLYDYERDGLVNLVEFAFGLNPKQNSAGQLPRGQIIGPNYIIFFNQPSGVSGVTYGAEWSTSLMPLEWTPITDTGNPPQRVFSVPIGSNTRMFTRFKVTSP